MAISTYTELKSAVADWLNREDLTAVIPTFVALTEADVNRSLRVRDMMTRAELNWDDSSVVPLPSDFLELYSIEQTYPPDGHVVPPLQYVGMDELKRLKVGQPTGTPRWYTIFGGNLEVWPAPSASGYDMTLTYYAAIPALSNDDQENWLLTRAPDLYLYGALLQASPYLKNDERIAVWDGAYQRALASLRAESERSMRPATNLNARSRAF